MEWVSVKDRLPSENGVWVLVYANGAMNCMGYYKGQWQDWVFAKAHNICVENITHWMLPEPPNI